VFADPSLAKPPKNAAKLSFKEAHTTTGSYLAPVLKAAPGLKPVSVGFLAGTLDYGRLDLLTRLYVRVLFGTPAGDYRNWEAIRAWAASLRLL
jgi:menaquinone-dependent protoporphyrinogen IX oxidase